jgi:hypothetical protein
LWLPQDAAKVGYARSVGQPKGRKNLMVMRRRRAAAEKLFAPESPTEHVVLVDQGRRSESWLLDADQRAGRCCARCGGFREPMIRIGVILAVGAPHLMVCEISCQRPGG